MLRVAMRLLSKEGGIFVGEGVVLTKDIYQLRSLPFWFFFYDPEKDPTNGIVFVNRGFNENTLEYYVQVIMANKQHCLTQSEYDQLEETGENHFLCLRLREDLYPRDIMTSDMPFAELARWLFYGQRRPLCVQHSDLVDLIPRVSHYLWISSDDPMDTNEFKFAQFISVLSALHVAQMDHVYVHGAVEPEGIWWAELRTENITFTRVALPGSVFQQPLNAAAHARDIFRYNVLYKHGGVYQDLNVVWTNQVPDRILGFPTVLSTEWQRYGQWPDSLNMGIILARRHAPFLRHFMSTQRYFREGNWNYNAVLMPYRTYEWHPDSLHLDLYLQAICSDGECHSAWADDYNAASTVDNYNDIVGDQASLPFNLQEVRAVQFRKPETPPSLSSPQSLTSGSDRFAAIGRYVLERSGRLDLLDGGQENSNILSVEI